MRLPTLSFLAVLLSASSAWAAQADVAIPAGPLSEALAALSRQAGVSVGGDLSLADRRSPGAKGPLTPEQALAGLLNGTGLGFRKVGDGIYRLEVLASRQVRPVDDRATEERLDPIIVTATKRGADPAGLPVAVGVLTAADLARLGATDFGMVLPLLGDVSSTHLGQGRNKLSIRGLSDSAFTGQTQATVGLYLDNAKVNYNAPDPHLRLIDVERVEVLRGPQGTLYGGGSIGGILRIVPVTPDLSERMASARLTGVLTEGGAPGGGAEAVLNQPLLADRLGLRMAFHAEREGGVIDDTDGRHDIDGTDIQGGRVLLAFVPADDWRLELGGTYQRIDARNSHYIQGLHGCCTRAVQLPEPHDSDFDEGHLTLSGKLSFADLHSTTAFVRHELDTFYDASHAVPDLAGLPVQPARFQEGQLSRLWTHETRLTGSAGTADEEGRTAIDWLAGLHLSWQVSGTSRALSPVADAGRALWRRDRDDTVREAALFGEIAWRFAPDWTLTMGGRVFHIAQEVAASATAPVADRADIEGYAHETDTTPKLALTWQPAHAVTVYAQMAEGYRPGGIDIDEAGADDSGAYRTARFGTDELWNYEVGTKLLLWQGRLSLDAALFHARWRNIQTDQLQADGLIFTTNAGDGRNTGIEIGPSLHLGPWRLQATLTLNDPELIRVAPGFAAPPDGGLPGAAHFSGGTSVSWQGNLVDGIDLSAGLEFTHTGRTNLTFAKGTRQGPVNLLNGRADFSLAGGWGLGLSVDNILNTTANQFAYGNPFTLPGSPQTTPPRPRAFKVNIAWSG